MFVRVFESLQRGHPSRNFWRDGRSRIEPGTAAGAGEDDAARKMSPTPRSRKYSSSSRPGGGVPMTPRVYAGSETGGSRRRSGVTHREKGVPDSVRDLALARARNGLAPPVAVEKQDLVRLGFEPDVGAPHVVDDDEVRSLRLHFSFPAGLQVLRLGGECDDSLAASERPQAREDVPAGIQADIHLSGVAVEPLRALDGDEIRHGRRHDEAVAFRKFGDEERVELVGGLERERSDPTRSRETRRPGEQRHTTPPVARGFRERESHAPARAVGDETDLVEALAWRHRR